MKLATRHIFATLALGLLIGLVPLQQAEAGKQGIGEILSSLATKQNIEQMGAIGIDPTQVTLSADYTVKAYFISEDSDYGNSISWYDGAKDPTNAKNLNSIWGKSLEPHAGDKMKVGQLQSFGRLRAGTNLGFAINSGEFSGNNRNSYYSNDALNNDGISHVMTGLLPEQGLLLVGFSDTRSYSGDFSDIIVAIDIGMDNAKGMAAAGAPEPSEWALLIAGTLTLGIVGMRRRKLELENAAKISIPA
jgi:hypothetical protein